MAFAIKPCGGTHIRHFDLAEIWQASQNRPASEARCSLLVWPSPAQCSATEKNKNTASRPAVPKTSGAICVIVIISNPAEESQALRILRFGLDPRY